MKAITKNYFHILLTCLFISACSHAPPKVKTEGLKSLPALACEKNYSEEMSLTSDWEHKTWAKYDNLDFKKGFDAARQSLVKMGYRVVSTDTKSGRISGESSTRDVQSATRSIHTKVDQEGSSLVIHVRCKAPRGAVKPSTLCAFYAEFEKQILESATKSTSVPAPVSPEQPRSPGEPQEAVKSVPSPSETVLEPAPAAPPLSATRSLSTPSPPSTVPSYSSASVLRETQVIWSYVNLREGPGLKYKVIGKATRGASLSVLEEKGGWLRVRLEDGKEVWMARVATSEGKMATSHPSPPQESSSPKVRSPM